MEKIGKIFALVGFLAALLLGFLEATKIIDVAGYSQEVTWILVIAGLVVGFLNVSKTESTPLMIAVLVIAAGAAALAVIPVVGEAVRVIFGRIATFVVPAGVLVACKVAYHTMKN